MESLQLGTLKIAVTSLVELCERLKAHNGDEVRLTLGIAFEVKWAINTIYDIGKDIESELGKVAVSGTVVSDFIPALTSIIHKLIEIGLEMSKYRKFKRNTANKIVEVIDGADAGLVWSFLSGYKDK